MSQSLERFIRSQFSVLTRDSFKDLNRQRMPQIDSMSEEEFSRTGIADLLELITEEVKSASDQRPSQ
jgi:hypothetical protein